MSEARTDPPDPATAFTLAAASDEHLAPDADTVRSVVAITAPPHLARSRDRVEVIVVDNSLSMLADGKLDAAQAAACAAVEQIEDGVAFAIIAGHDAVRPVWPAGARRLATAGPRERDGAIAAIGRLACEGGTVIGSWLAHAAQLVGSTGERNLAHVLLLSDGRNQHQSRAELAEVVARCRSLLQCDCWGIGEDWDPLELRHISDELGGRTEAAVRVDDAPGRDELVAGFRARIRASQARVAPDLSMVVRTRGVAEVVAFRQATPVLRDLGERAGPLPDGEAGASYPLGSWAPLETRSYFVSLRIHPDRLGGVGDRLRVASIELVLADGTIAAGASLAAEWSDDLRRLTAAVPAVERHLDQAELADDTDSGTRALQAGDRVAARSHLARAWRTAERLGASDHQERLARLVEVNDATGVIELRTATTGDVIRAQTYSTATAAYRHDRRDDTAELEYIDPPDTPGTGP